MKLFVILIILNFVSCSNSHHDIRSKSIHFNLDHFQNEDPTGQKGLFAFLKMRMRTTWSQWPEWIETKKQQNIEQRFFSKKIKVSYINHSTYLIQTQGLNILTDPIFSKRCSPVSFIGPKRVHAPSIDIHDLPPIDLILLSHDHYDHLDLDSLNIISKKTSPQIYTGLGVGKVLNRKNVNELDWWQSSSFSKELKVTFVPVQHFSGRGLFDRDSTLWGGFVVEVNNRKIYFGGDSGYAKHYTDTYQRFGEMDLSFLPIGAYAPRSFMSYVHMDPREAVLAHTDLKSKKSIGMHYGTFQLTAEKINEPLELLGKEMSKKSIPDDEFVVLELGKSYLF